MILIQSMEDSGCSFPKLACLTPLECEEEDIISIFYLADGIVSCFILTCYVHDLTSVKQTRVHLLDRETFSDVFGPKTKRKRPKLLAADYESLAKKADGSQGNFFFLYMLLIFPVVYCLIIWLVFMFML